MSTIDVETLAYCTILTAKRNKPIRRQSRHIQQTHPTAVTQLNYAASRAQYTTSR